jgi:hypothetical protein
MEYNKIKGLNEYLDSLKTINEDQELELPFQYGGFEFAFSSFLSMNNTIIIEFNYLEENGIYFELLTSYEFSLPLNKSKVFKAIEKDLIDLKQEIKNQYNKSMLDNAS